MTLGVGVIGLGIGVKHMEAYMRHPACRVRMVCDWEASRLQAVRARDPSIATTRSAEELIHHPDIQLLSIASYDNDHARQAEQAIRLGKHVLVEKPLCLLPEEAQRLRQALREHPGVRLSSNLNLRSCPRFRVLKARLTQGQLGVPFYLEADYLWGRVEKLTEGWRGRMPYYSIILGASVHMVDLVVWLLGLRPVSVFSQGQRLVTAQSAFQYDDFNVMLLRFENGVVAKIMATAGCCHPHFHRLAVYATRETFAHDYLGGGRLTSSLPAVAAEALEGDYPARDQKPLVIDSFVDALTGKKEPPLVSEQDVFDVMSICFAAEKSARQQGPVEIEYM